MVTGSVTRTSGHRRSNTDQTSALTIPLCLMSTSIRSPSTSPAISTFAQPPSCSDIDVRADRSRTSLKPFRSLRVTVIGLPVMGMTARQTLQPSNQTLKPRHQFRTVVRRQAQQPGDRHRHGHPWVRRWRSCWHRANRLAMSA